jgi:putative NIF3 family GTP cyclohydrolase 1 type 2
MLLTGEATFHTCLEARSLGIGLGLLGHFSSERFAMESLAKQLAYEVDSIEVWPSKNESDPVQKLA